MRIVEGAKKYMNTDITIKLVQQGESTVNLQEAMEKAFGEFERIVKRFSRFVDNSELSNLNRNAGHEVQVSEEMIVLIEKMLEYHKLSEGAFDPTVIDFLEMYGYDKNYDFNIMNNQTELDTRLKGLLEDRKGFDTIQIFKEKSTVMLHSKQRIDLGGIGKGYAIDCAAEKMKQISQNFIIDAGGDIYARGVNQEDKTWTVAMRAKDSNGEVKDFGVIELKNQALAASGSWARKVGNFHHLLDPKTGKPIEKNYGTVFVIADSATDADVWATAFFVKPELAEKIDFKSMFV